MKNSYRIINLLRRLFKVFLWASIVNVLIVIGFITADFFTTVKENNSSVVVIENSQNILNEKLLVEAVSKAGWIYKYSSDADSTFQISHPFDALFFSVLVLLMFYYSHRFFIELQKGFKTGCLFFEANYLRIKKIGFLLLTMLFYSWIKVIFNYVINSKSSIGKLNSFHFEFDSSDLTPIVMVLLIFVFAEIYRAGIEMKEESEYTI